MFTIFYVMKDLVTVLQRETNDARFLGKMIRFFPIFTHLHLLTVISRFIIQLTNILGYLFDSFSIVFYKITAILLLFCCRFIR